MKALYTAVVFTFIGACAAQRCLGGELLKSGLSHDLQMKILHLHNTLRDKVAEGIIAAQPMAENMKEMIWDTELAVRAQDWANNCIFQHEHPRTNRKGHLYGQNISHRDKTWSSDEGEWEVLSKMIAEWFDEVYKSYDSLHFSQMVWANTHKIGCGYSEYNSNGRVIAIFVCNYFPSGNIIGTEPYERGARSCEKHGLSSSRSYGSLCSVDEEEEGSYNLQYDYNGPQQWRSGHSAVEQALQFAQNNPLQLLRASPQRSTEYSRPVHQFTMTSYPLQPQTLQSPFGGYQTSTVRGVQSINPTQLWSYHDQYSPLASSYRNGQTQTSHQLVPPITTLQSPYQWVQFGGYQGNTIGSVQPVEQTQEWNYPAQYSSLIPSPRHTQTKQNDRRFLSPDQLRLLNNQASTFEQYHANNIRASPIEQQQLWNYTQRYSLNYQQPHSPTNFMHNFQYFYTNPTSYVSPHQIRTSSIQSTPTIQGTPTADVERIVQFKLPGYQVPWTYRSNQVNMPTSEYQPTNSYGYSSQYQPTNSYGYSSQYQPTNSYGYSSQYQATPVRDQQRWPSDSSSAFENGLYRGTNLQGFAAPNFVSVSTPQTVYSNSVLQPSYSASWPQMGYTTGFNGIVDSGSTYGNTLSPFSQTADSPMFDFEGSLDPNLVAHYKTPYYIPVIPKPVTLRSVRPRRQTSLPGAKTTIR